MSCCGEKRAQLVNTPKTSLAPKQKDETSSDHKPISSNTLTYFQYIGKKSLMVIGRETRRLYRFRRPGAVVAVDQRDQRALEKVPTLRLVRIVTL